MLINVKFDRACNVKPVKIEANNTLLYVPH